MSWHICAEERLWHICAEHRLSLRRAPVVLPFLVASFFRHELEVTATEEWIACDMLRRVGVSFAGTPSQRPSLCACARARAYACGWMGACHVPVMGACHVPVCGWMGACHVPVMGAYHVPVCMLSVCPVQSDGTTYVQSHAMAYVCLPAMAYVCLPAMAYVCLPWPTLMQSQGVAYVC